MLIIYAVAQLLVAVYLIIPFFLLVSHYWRKSNKRLLKYKYPVVFDKNFDFAAIITAHQDVRFIRPLVDSFLKQSYANFIVYIIADDCDTTGLDFPDERIRIIKPGTPFHAKIRSIKYGVSQFVRDHDVIVIFDADNLVHPDYLKNLNEYFRHGFEAVQTHMLSKNIDSVYAKLDSMGHVYNTFIERQARMELGLSSCILGLGIAIKTGLYREVMYKDTLGGFDKKLQAEIVKRVKQLAFAEDALVYDEKVTEGNAFERQRTRWIYTYFKYFPDNWSLFINGLRNLNFNRIYFGFNAMRPPLFITIGLAIIFMVSVFFLDPFISLLWAGIILLFSLTFILIVLTQSRQKGMGKVFFYLPALVFRQLKGFLRIKKAKTDFLKTEHSKIVYIDDILSNEIL